MAAGMNQPIRKHSPKQGVNAAVNNCSNFAENLNQIPRGFIFVYD